MKGILNNGEKMTVKQVSIFLENKEGRIREAINILGEANVNILALSIADTSKYGILRLIVDDNKKTLDAFEKENFITSENEVIVATVPDKPNGLNTILKYLGDGKNNIEYIYAFSSVKLDEAIVVIKLENIDDGIELLNKNNVTLLDEEDLDKL